MFQLSPSNYVIVHNLINTADSYLSYMGNPEPMHDRSWLTKAPESPSSISQEAYYGAKPMQTEVYQHSSTQHQPRSYGTKPMQTETYQQGYSQYQPRCFGSRPRPTHSCQHCSCRCLLRIDTRATINAKCIALFIKAATPARSKFLLVK
ncbi:hypothetical protein CEK25_012180 [Fusarium fujikuroi]|nr:hypothetical protein CEK25_012180 [Fusarium fujikuroi]